MLCKKEVEDRMYFLLKCDVLDVLDTRKSAWKSLAEEAHDVLNEHHSPSRDPAGRIASGCILLESYTSI